MPSIRKTKKRLKRLLKDAEKTKRILSHEHYLHRTMGSLMKVVAVCDRIEYLEQDLEDLKRKK